MKTSKNKTKGGNSTKLPEALRNKKIPIEILESGKSLSECLVWGMLEDFYSNAGIAAWEQVPFYPTSNSFIGESYAEAIIAFLLDYSPYLNKDEPVYIVEMATGTGCFSFYTIKELHTRKAYFESLKDVKICYLMTDFAENNVQSWEKDPVLKPYLDEGMLDFAIFLPEYDKTLALRRSKVTLTPETVKNPIIAIANYFFDSIKQEFFRYNTNKKLHLAQLTYYREGEQAFLKTKPAFDEIKKLDSFVEVPSEYYADPKLNQVLQFYRDNLEESSVLFPIGAFNCIRNLQALSHDNLMLLSTDKGFTYLDYLNGHWDVPFTPHHGIISYMVNFHAIGRYFLDHGGHYFSTDENYTLNTSVGIMVTNPECKLENSRYYLEEKLKKKNPITNLYNCRGLFPSLSTEEKDYQQTYRTCIALLELSNYDPYFFTQAGPKLNEMMKYTQWYEKDVLKAAMVRVKDNLYVSTLGRYETYNLLRELYYEMDAIEQCLQISHEIVSLFEPEHNNLYYIAACNEVNGNFGTALEYYEKARLLEPDNEMTHSGINRMQAKLIPEQAGI